MKNYCPICYGGRNKKFKGFCSQEHLNEYFAMKLAKKSELTKSVEIKNASSGNIFVGNHNVDEHNGSLLRPGETFDLKNVYFEMINVMAPKRKIKLICEGRNKNYVFALAVDA